MTYLLDINVLIALFDRKHVHSQTAHRWFESAKSSWATCPITENGFVRILSNPRYHDLSIAPVQAIDGIQRMCEDPNHVFWPDSVSLLERLVGEQSLIRPSQVTDFYLASLAQHHGGKLATLDQRIATDHAALAPAIETLPVG